MLLEPRLYWQLTNKLILIVLLLASRMGMMGHGHPSHASLEVRSLGHVGLLWSLLSIGVGRVVVVPIILPRGVVLVVLLVVLRVVGSTWLLGLLGSRLLLTSAPRDVNLTCYDMTDIGF